MKKTLRLLLGLLLLFTLAAIAVDRRSRRVRCAYRIRELLDRRAVIRNEIRFLRGEILRLEDTEALLARARQLGLSVGRRWGPEAEAPPAVTAPGDE